MDIVQDIAIGVTLFALIISMISDFKSYKIPNIASLMIVGAFFSFACVSYSIGMIMYHVVAALLVFGLCFLLYLKKMFGAGDVKLLSAISLWAGPSMVLPLLFFVSLIGGLLGVVYLIRFKANAVSYKKIPYGLAIGMGSFVILSQSFLFI